MKKLVFAFAVVAAGCLASCNNSTSSTETTTPETPQTEVTAPVVEPVDTPDTKEKVEEAPATTPEAQGTQEATKTAE